MLLCSLPHRPIPASQVPTLVSMALFPPNRYPSRNVVGIKSSLDGDSLLGHMLDVVADMVASDAIVSHVSE